MTDRVPDRGVAWIRTRLAWRRTLLSLGVVALLAARLAVTHGPVGAVLAAVAVGGWGLAGLAVTRRTRSLVFPPHDGPATVSPPHDGPATVSPPRHGPATVSPPRQGSAIGPQAPLFGAAVVVAYVVFGLALIAV